MEQPNVIYMTPEEAQNVDPASIDTVTMTTGTIVKVADQGEDEEFQEENIESNMPICEKCGLPKDISNTTENVFRAAPEGEIKEEEQEVEVEGEAGEEQKEVLKGPNGMPLLGEIISGGNLTDQNNYYNNTGNNTQIQIPVPSVQVNPPNQPPMVQPPIVQPPVVQPPPKEQKPIIPTVPVQAPVPMKPPVVPQAQRPFQPPQTINPPMPKSAYPTQQKYVRPPVQQPMMPGGRGPVNPTFKPTIPPRPYCVIPPKRPPQVIPPKVAPRPPEVIRPVNGPKKGVMLHPGRGPYGPQNGVFRNRKKEVEEEVLCPDCQNEVLCPDCAKLETKNETICPDCLKKEKENEKRNNKNVTKPEIKKGYRKKENDKTNSYERKNKEIKKPEIKRPEIKKDYLKKDYLKKDNNNNTNKTDNYKNIGNKIDNKTKDVNFDNYKYHEINVKTEKNLKSQVIVKKEGVIIASHEE